MKTTIDKPETYQAGQYPLPQERLSHEDIPLPAAKSRLGWRVAFAVFIETLTLIAVMVTLASNHFGIVSYILGVIGILIPLALISWGFWYLTRDEAHWREEVRKEAPAPTRQPKQPPVSSRRETRVPPSPLIPVHS